MADETAFSESMLRLHLLPAGLQSPPMPSDQFQSVCGSFLTQVGQYHFKFSEPPLSPLSGLQQLTMADGFLAAEDAPGLAARTKDSGQRSPHVMAKWDALTVVDIYDRPAHTVGTVWGRRKGLLPFRTHSHSALVGLPGRKLERVE